MPRPREGRHSTLVSLLGSADADMVGRARAAAAATGDIDACRDTAALREAFPPPYDPKTVAEVAALSAELGRISALREVGRIKEGRAAAQAVVPRARALAYPPILAAALRREIEFEHLGGDDAVAVAAAYETAAVAAQARDDAEVARAFASVEMILGNDGGHREAADVAFQAARAAANRAGNPPRTLSFLFQCRARVLRSRDDRMGALHLELLTLALDRTVDGPSAPRLPMDLARVGDTFHEAARPDAARPYYDRALAGARDPPGRVRARPSCGRRDLR